MLASDRRPIDDGRPRQANHVSANAVGSFVDQQTNEMDSQLIMDRLHICRSRGYSLRFIGQDSVSEILQNQVTRPPLSAAHSL